MIPSRQTDREIQKAEELIEQADRLRRRGRQPKMKCPNDKCPSHDSHVVRCRISLDGSVMRRRRECDTCGARFNTTERIEKSA